MAYGNSMCGPIKKGGGAIEHGDIGKFVAKPKAKNLGKAQKARLAAMSGKMNQGMENMDDDD